MTTEQKTLDDLTLMIAEGLEDLTYKQTKHVLEIMFPGIKIRVIPNQYRNGIFDVTWPVAAPEPDDGSTTTISTLRITP